MSNFASWWSGLSWSHASAAAMGALVLLCAIGLICDALHEARATRRRRNHMLERRRHFFSNVADHHKYRTFK